jgi:hypothetical protein
LYRFENAYARQIFRAFLTQPRSLSCVVVKRVGCGDQAKQTICSCQTAAAAAQSNKMVWHVSRDLAAHAIKTIETAAEAVLSTDGSSSNDEPGPAAAEPNNRVVYEIPLAVLILILYIVLGHSLELWKNHQQADAAAKSFLMPITRRRQPKALLCTFHESGPAILLGLAVGLMMNYGAGQQFDFNADIFFYVVLPPIIFHQVSSAVLVLVIPFIVSRFASKHTQLLRLVLS